MKRREYVATVEIDGRPSVRTDVRYAHNSALDAGKNVLRDLHAGAWTIAHAVPGDLTLINDRDGRHARITVKELS